MSGNQHIGSQVLVRCGSSDIYDGIIRFVNPKNQSMTLTGCIHNGVALVEPVIVKAETITDLKILKLPQSFELANNIKSINATPEKPNIDQSIHRLLSKLSVGEKSAPQISSTVDRIPIRESVATRINRSPIGFDNIIISDSNTSESLLTKTPSGLRNGQPESPNDFSLIGSELEKMSKQKRAQLSHFEEPLDMQLMQQDFDFEANLALFDKIPSTSAKMNLLEKCNTVSSATLMTYTLAATTFSNGNHNHNNGDHSATSGGDCLAEILEKCNINSSSSKKLKNYRHDENILKNPDDIYVNPPKALIFKDEHGSTIQPMNVDEKKVILRCIQSDDDLKLTFGQVYAVAVCQCVFEIIQPRPLNNILVRVVSGQSELSRELANNLIGHLKRRNVKILLGRNSSEKLCDLSIGVGCMDESLSHDRNGTTVFVESDWTEHILPSCVQPPDYVIFWHTPVNFLKQKNCPSNQYGQLTCTSSFFVCDAAVPCNFGTNLPANVVNKNAVTFGPRFYTKIFKL